MLTFTPNYPWPYISGVMHVVRCNLIVQLCFKLLILPISMRKQTFVALTLHSERYWLPISVNHILPRCMECRRGLAMRI